jgi:hypothetical protein
MRERRGAIQQARWFRTGIAALVVLLVAIATAMVASGPVVQVMPSVAAIASVVGIGAFLRWAVLRDKGTSAQ